MNAVLADMYSTVIPSAPYLIAAYAIVWIALLVYVVMVVRALKRAEAHIALLEDRLEKLGCGTHVPRGIDTSL